MNSFHARADGYTTTGEPFVESHPIESLEPEELPSDAAMAARIRFLEIICDWAAGVHKAFSQANPSASTIAAQFYGPGFAVAVPCLDGVSMTSIAERFNLSRACISKLAVQFAEAHDLPASRYLKDESSRTSYSQARVESIKQNGNGNGSMPHPPDKGRSV